MYTCILEIYLFVYYLFISTQPRKDKYGLLSDSADVANLTTILRADARFYLYNSNIEYI